MADRWGNPRPTEEDKTVLFKKVAGGIALGAAAGALGFGLYRLLNQNEKVEQKEEDTVDGEYSDEEDWEPTQQQQIVTTGGYETNLARGLSQIGIGSSGGENPPIVIAVDTNLTKGGGLLILPKTKTIFFYSIDWSSILKFENQSGKFEMTNVMLGLLLFENFVREYRDRLLWDNTGLFLKVDNEFYKGPSGKEHFRKHLDFQKLRNEINNKLSGIPFEGEYWTFTEDDPAKDDFDIKVADMLTHNEDYTLINCLSQLKPFDNANPFPGYPTQINISSSDFIDNALREVASYLPSK